MQNIISKAYLYANEPLVGISVCAPFFMDDYDGIFGTTCLDVAPQGELGEYFNFDDTNQQEQNQLSVDKDNFFVIMNPDPEL